MIDDKSHALKCGRAGLWRLWADAPIDSRHRPAAGSNQRDDAALTDALPRQAEHQGIELGAAQAGLGCTVGCRPDKVALVQPPGRQPLPALELTALRAAGLGTISDAEFAELLLREQDFRRRLYDMTEQAGYDLAVVMHPPDCHD